MSDKELVRRLRAHPCSGECVSHQAADRIEQLEEALLGFADEDTEIVLRNMLGDDVQHDCAKGTGTNEPQYHTCPGCWFEGMFEDARALLGERWKFDYEGDE